MNAERIRIHPFRILRRIVVCLGFLALSASAQTQTQTTHHATHPGASTATRSGEASQPPQMKGIWEPMNYPDDVQFESVYFANDNVGWIAGKGSGGFILHTTDGGAHWNVQMGDPHSNDPELSSLRFLDATHGWAYQAGGQLVRTTDGNTWETVGPFPNFPAQFRFVSAQNGFALTGDFRGSSVISTQDGGRSWKDVYDCNTTIQVNGLVRNTSCYLNDFYFPTTRVGYAVGGDYGGSWAAIVKTTDGGKTWQVIFASTQLAAASHLFFTDENNGVVRLGDDRIIITADGGQTWRGATGTSKGDFKFADPEVGWSCLEQYGPSCSISLDGGKSWTAHDFSLPSDIYDYSVPRRDRLYVVGQHGMIYRYRLAPVTYSAQGTVDYAAVPSYGGPIVGQLQQMQSQVAALQTQLGAPPASAPSASGGGFSQGAAPPQSGADAPFANQAAPPSGGFSQSSSSASSGGSSQDNSGQSSAAAAPAAQDASASGGFSQDATAGSSSSADASASGGFSQDASATGGTATADPTATAAGFSQTASAAPTSQFVQTTCASAVQSMQTILTSVVTMIPQFGTQFKNLNNLFAGLNMLSTMMASANQIKNDFVALKKATDAQAALAALADLSTTLQKMSEGISTQFSSLSASSATAGGSGGGIGNQAIGNQATGSSATSAASGQPASAGSTASQTATSTAKSTANSAKSSAISKLKSKIPGF